ncbi:MAG: SusD/RagB family nutrient-binding outer membrane lipoprotein [Ferruginibacter sp.]
MKMNNIKRITLALSTALVVAGTGCKVDYDINSSTEDLTAGAVDYKTVLPTAINNSARIIAADWKFLQSWMGYWARSGSYQNVADEETYNFTNDFPAAGGNGAGNPWNDLYYNSSNYNYVQKNAVSNGAGMYEAICRIMKAQNFQILTDVYGDVPYFEALKGNDVRTPKYDKGEDIYNDLFRQLDTAIAILHDADASSAAKNPDISRNDLVFKGDPAKWIKFANTLKLAYAGALL